MGELLTLAPYGALNVHGSLLPELRRKLPVAQRTERLPGTTRAEARVVIDTELRDEALVVEVSVNPTAIDNLHVGQEAALRFPAFNMRTTPSIPGVISNISADRHINENTDESYYKVEIALAGKRPGHVGDLQLLPGMPVEAHIRTAERTPMSYLIKPLTDQLGQGRHQFREVLVFGVGRQMCLTVFYGHGLGRTKN